jgi:hypothetical protein
LAKIRALPQCAAPVIVFDGTPGPNWPATWVAVGGNPDPDEAGIVTWSALGARRQEGNYEVEFTICSLVGGSDNLGQPGSSDAQATARMNVSVIFDAISDALRADVNFSAQNGGPALVQWCNISKMLYKQTPNPEIPNDDGSLGRSSKLKVWIAVREYVESS